MARINQDLLQAIADKQHVSVPSAYRRVSAVVGETVLKRELAALLLATRLGINIHKYSTHAQREQIRSYLTGGGSSRVASPTEISRVADNRTPTRSAKLRKAKKTKDNSVFVVHGRDEALRKSMFAFLRALGLNPMEWAQAVHQAKGPNPDVREIIDSAMARVQAVVVLFSPDEMAYLKKHFCSLDDKQSEGKPAGQARPNVLFEAGLALGAHPDKTVIVQVGRVRPFSDIAGKHLAKLTNDPAKRNDLANRLAKIGCNVNRIGDDWMTAGIFEPTEPKIRKAKKPASRKSG